MDSVFVVALGDLLNRIKYPTFTRVFIVGLGEKDGERIF